MKPSYCHSVREMRQNRANYLRELHVIHIFLVDLQHPLAVPEAPHLCRAVGLYLPDHVPTLPLHPPEHEAKALALGTLQLAQSGHRARVGVWGEEGTEGRV